MKKIIFISLLFLGALAFGQTVNPNQIRPSATNGQVLTTESGATVWHDPAAGGVSSAQGISPITVNGNSSTPHTGDITIACDGCGGLALQLQVVPPIAGQFVVIWPADGGASCTAGGDKCQSGGAGGVNATGFVTALPHNSVQTVSGTISFGAWSLPSYVNPANVTAIYGFAAAATTGPITNQMSCAYTGGSESMYTDANNNGTFTVLLTGLTGANVSTVGCNASPSSSLFTAPFITSTAASSMALIVYYTGTPPPANTTIFVAPPLTLFNNTLTVNLAQPFPGLYELPYLVSQLPTSATSPVVPVTGAVYNVVDGASAIDCSTGGGSTQVSCQWNGSSYVAVGGTGSGGLSGMTAGQVPIAANATTVTSSKTLAGVGAGITTGPTTSVNGDITCFSGTTGQLSDCGTPLASLVTLTGTQSLTNKTINGVVLSNGGSSSVFLDGTGAYSSPAGSGTVTHTGALTSGQVVIGNNSADIKVDTGCSTDGSGNQTCASLATNGPTPGKLSLGAGTGSIPALGASSAGFAAPVSGGTSYLFKLPATASAGILAAGTPGTVDGVNESAITVVPFPWSCQPGLGDGLNAISAATYLQTTCYNDTGKTVTLTGIKCFTDNSGSSTLAATNGAGTALLTGAVTCTTAFAAGTQSATTTIAAGDFIKFTFVADGTSKQGTFVVSGTHP